MRDTCREARESMTGEPEGVSASEVVAAKASDLDARARLRRALPGTSKCKF